MDLAKQLRAHKAAVFGPPREMMLMNLLILIGIHQNCSHCLPHLNTTKTLIQG